METDDRSRAVRALGPDWTALRSVVQRWMETNVGRLQRQWDFPMSDVELLNHELGAFLHDPADATVFDYDATPRHSFTFASTGVDGEHYSVLLDDDSSGLVVLTAPMAFDREHVVVGESLREALALVSGGCGLAVPPGLTYGPWDHVIDLIQAPKESPLWHDLREGLGLTPWSDPASRLAELRDRHLGSVHWSRPRDDTDEVE